MLNRCNERQISTAQRNKVAACIYQYKSFNDFQYRFSKENATSMLSSYQDNEQLIYDDKVPSISVARIAFGDANVKAVIMSHLFQMCQACGITSTADAIDAITDDILHGFGDLKISELILAFRYIREGKFREREGERNSGEFYGALSTSVICNCLSRYRREFRNPCITSHEQKEANQRRIQDDQKAATYEERRQIIFASVLTAHPNKMGAQLNSLKDFIKKEDMPTLEYYASERKLLLLLKQRVEEYIFAVSANNDDPSKSKEGQLPEFNALVKGIKIINDKFPYEVEQASESIIKP